MPKDTTLQDSFDRLAVVAKKLAEGKEPRKYDFSSTPIALTLGQNEGTTLGNLAKPANFDKVPVGSEAKIAVNIPTNPADLPPTDDVQMAMIGTYLGINKAQGNVMNGGEVKTQLQAGKIMVLERLADVVVGGNSYRVFQLARGEDNPAKPQGGHGETIDQTTYHFDKPHLVRITGDNQTIITGYLQGSGTHGFIAKTTFINDKYTRIDYGGSFNHVKTNIDQKSHELKPDNTEIITLNKPHTNITKFEIGKDA